MGKPHSAVLPILLGMLILVAIACFPQPLVYDAGQYFALSQEVRWEGLWPTLPADGLRTYAYPLMVRCLGPSPTILYLVQGGMLVGLMTILRRRLWPPSMFLDLVVVAMFLAVPALTSYCAVMLADIPGLVMLQWGLLLLALLPLSRRWWTAMSAGACMSAAVQLRPAYLPLAYAVLGLGSVWVFAHKPFPRRGELFQSTLLIVALMAGAMMPALPTMVAQFQKTGHLEIVPSEGMERLRGYHLMLGLQMDRWSSNPPPFEEHQCVAEIWRQQGWAILPIEPWPSPKVGDYLAEVARDPLHATRQCLIHVAFAFHKSEVSAYAGRPTPFWKPVLMGMNIVVLLLGGREIARRAFRRPSTRQACSNAAHHQFGTSGDTGTDDLERRSTDRRFAILQCVLWAYLAVTCALVVPEERFTFAAYPVAMIFAAGALTSGILGAMSRFRAVFPHRARLASAHFSHSVGAHVQSGPLPRRWTR